MNLLVQQDAIQDMEKIEECYQSVAMKLMPGELIGGADDTGSQMDGIIEHIKSI